MMDMNVKMNKMMDIVEEKMPEDGRVCIHMLLNDGHHDEYTAHCKIRKMVPVTYLGITPEPHDIMEMVEALGLTPMKAREMVYAAYEDAKPLVHHNDGCRLLGDPQRRPEGCCNACIPVPFGSRQDGGILVL